MQSEMSLGLKSARMMFRLLLIIQIKVKPRDLTALEEIILVDWIEVMKKLARVEILNKVSVVALLTALFTN